MNGAASLRYVICIRTKIYNAKDKAKITASVSFKIFDEQELDNCKILKASSTSVELEQLKLDEAHNCRVGKDQLLKWRRVLTPAILKVCHKKLLPWTIFGDRSENP